MFAYAVTIIVNMTIYNLWLNCAQGLSCVHHVLYCCWWLFVSCEYHNGQSMVELMSGFTARASYLHIITIWSPTRDSNCKHYTNQLMVEPCLYFIACTAILYYYTECHINRKTYIIQPMVESRLCFTAPAPFFELLRAMVHKSWTLWQPNHRLYCGIKIWGME